MNAFAKFDLYAATTHAPSPSASGPISDQIDGTPKADNLNGSDGRDTLRGLDGDDVLSGFGDNDKLYGGAGNDYLKGADGADLLDGGGGIDRAGYYGAPGGVTVSLLLQGQAQDTGFGRDTLVGIEDVSGGAGDDVLTGDGGDNWLWGSIGGNDKLIGNGGNDLLEVSQPGTHTLNGGDGVDSLVITDENAGGLASITVDLTKQGARQDTGVGRMLLTDIENVSGSGHQTTSDTLIGDGGGNVLAGAQGDDALTGGGGRDLLLGDGFIGIDSSGGGGAGPITVFQSDIGEGADTLSGGGAVDTLIGGAGADRLTGGAGGDRFVFLAIGDSAASAPDLITDLEGRDRIDLSAIDADGNAANGDTAFHLVGAFSGEAGQAALAYDRDARVTHLMLDVDGDDQADAVIDLAGKQTSYDHFVL